MGGLDFVHHNPGALGKDAVNAAADGEDEIGGFQLMVHHDFRLIAGRARALDALVGPYPLQGALGAGEGRLQVAGLQNEGHQRADGNGQAGFQKNHFRFEDGRSSVKGRHALRRTDRAGRR